MRGAMRLRSAPCGAISLLAAPANRSTCQSSRVCAARYLCRCSAAITTVSTIIVVAVAVAIAVAVALTPASRAHASHLPHAKHNLDAGRDIPAYTDACRCRSKTACPERESVAHGMKRC